MIHTAWMLAAAAVATPGADALPGRDPPAMAGPSPVQSTSRSPHGVNQPKQNRGGLSSWK